MAAGAVQTRARAVLICPASQESNRFQSVDVQLFINDAQLPVHHRNVALDAVQVLLPDVVFVLTAERIGIAAYIMTGTAGGLIGTGPNGSIVDIAAREPAVAISPRAGSGGAVPDGAATIGNTMPCDFRNGIEWLSGGR